MAMFGKKSVYGSYHSQYDGRFTIVQMASLEWRLFDAKEQKCSFHRYLAGAKSAARVILNKEKNIQAVCRELAREWHVENSLLT